MITKMAGLFFLLTILLAGCSVGKNTYSPDRKFSLKQVEKDYSLYQSILEAHHPSLYWYTLKDSMNYYFKYGKSLLKDSMTEIGFSKNIKLRNGTNWLWTYNHPCFPKVYKVCR